MTDDLTHDPDEIIRRVLGPLLPGTHEYVRRGSRRCVLVLDDSTAVLASALKDANFWVVSPSREMSLADFHTRDLLLAGRILVTRSTAAYLADAPVADFGIIGLDALPNIATTASHPGNATVKMISRAVTRHRPASRPPAWVIMLVPSGEHVFVRLE